MKRDKVILILREGLEDDLQYWKRKKSFQRKKLLL